MKLSGQHSVGPKVYKRRTAMDAPSRSAPSQHGRVHDPFLEATEGHPASEAEQGDADVELLPFQM